MKKKMIITSIISSFLLSFASLFFNISKVFAEEENKLTKEEEKDLLGLYDKYDYILHIDDGFFITDVGRSFLWGLISILAWINTKLETVVYKIITLNNFYSSAPINKLMSTLKPIIFSMFLVALVVLGFQFMLNKIEKRNEIFLNILMSVSILVVIPVLMSSMGDILSAGLKYTKDEKGTLAGSVIQSNVADLKYYMDKSFVSDGSSDNKYHGNKSLPPLPQHKHYPARGTTDFTYANQLDKYKPEIAITETIDVVEDESWIPGKTKEWVKNLKENNRTAYDFMKHKKLPTGVSNDSQVAELYKNAIPGTKIGREAYYRWHVNWGTVIFTLAVTAFALAITIVKIGRAIFDLAFHQFFGMFVSATDLTGGQRTKKVLVEIANTFGVMFIMVFILQLFTLYANWVNTLRADIGSIPVILLLIAGAWAVIDAPDIVARIMGIDAGLKSGYGALMGAYAGVGLAKGVSSGVGKVASGIASKGAGLAGMGTGLAKGLAGKGGQRKKADVAQMPKGTGGGGGGNPPTGGGGSGNEPPNIPPIDGGRGVKVEQDKIPETDSLHSDLSGNKEGLEPSGYTKTESGMLIPKSKNQQEMKKHQQNKSQQTIPESQQSGSDGTGSETINSGTPQMANMAEQISQMSQQISGIQQATQGYGGQGGVITGSGLFHSMSNSFQRGATTGEFLGGATRSTAGFTWKTAGSAVNGGKNAVKRVASSDMMQPVTETIKSVGSNAGYMAHKAQSKITGATQTVTTTVKEQIRNVGSNAGYMVHKAQNNIAGATQTVTSTVKEQIRNVGSNAGYIAHKAQGNIAGATQTVTTTVKEQVRRVGSNASYMAHKAQSNIAGATQTVTTTVKERIRNVGSNAGYMAHKAQSNITGATQPVTTTVKEQIRNVGSNAGYIAHKAQGNIAGATQTVTTTVKEQVRRVGSNAGYMAHKAQSNITGATQTVTTTVKEKVNRVGSNSSSSIGGSKARIKNDDIQGNYKK